MRGNLTIAFALLPPIPSPAAATQASSAKYYRVWYCSQVSGADCAFPTTIIATNIFLDTVIATDICLEAANVPGRGPFLYEIATNTADTSSNAADELHSRRMNALSVYTVILCCQILGIFIS